MNIFRVVASVDLTKGNIDLCLYDLGPVNKTEKSYVFEGRRLKHKDYMVVGSQSFRDDWSCSRVYALPEDVDRAKSMVIVSLVDKISRQHKSLLEQVESISNLDQTMSVDGFKSEAF